MYLAKCCSISTSWKLIPLLIIAEHKALTDEIKASLDGEDLRVLYRPNETSLPHEIDRVVTGLYTKEANVQLKIHEMIPGDTVEDSSYVLVFGGKIVGKAKADPRKVFAFFRGLFEVVIEQVDSGVG